jgi:hypothetical protein
MAASWPQPSPPVSRCILLLRYLTQIPRRGWPPRSTRLSGPQVRESGGVGGRRSFLIRPLVAVQWFREQSTAACWLMLHSQHRGYVFVARLWPTLTPRLIQLPGWGGLIDSSRKPALRTPGFEAVTTPLHHTLLRENDAQLLTLAAVATASPDPSHRDTRNTPLASYPLSPPPAPPLASAPGSASSGAHLSLSLSSPCMPVSYSDFDVSEKLSGGAYGFVKATVKSPSTFANFPTAGVTSAGKCIWLACVLPASSTP